MACCDQVSAQLYGWLKSNNSGYGQLSQGAAASQLEVAAHDGYEQRLTAAFTTIVDVTGGCREHAGVQAAFTEFDVLVDPQ